MTPNNAVVLLEMMCGGKAVARGAGVLYRRNDQVYIVTAWHNVTGRHSETVKLLSGIVPDQVRAHIATRLISSNGVEEGSTRRAIDLALEDNGQATYLVHPKGYPRIDVVAIPIDPDAIYATPMQTSVGDVFVFRAPLRAPPSDGGLGTDIHCIQDFAGAAAQFSIDFAKLLSVSDDLFIVGYPKGITDRHVQPLWKRATVATLPQLGWDGQRKFLVDCASREGMSGAPVLTYNKTGQMQVGGATYMGSGPATLLHGIYVSRVGGGLEFEAQIGTVWKREVIDEIIDGGVHGEPADNVEATNTEIRDLIRARWPSEKAGDFAGGMTAGTRPSIYFSHELAEVLNGRAGIDHIDALVREEAKDRAAMSPE